MLANPRFYQLCHFNLKLQRQCSRFKMKLPFVAWNFFWIFNLFALLFFPAGLSDGHTRLSGILHWKSWFNTDIHMFSFHRLVCCHVIH